MRPKILFFAPILEYPPAGGPQLSVVNAIKVLHRISELHIVTTVPRRQTGDETAWRFFESHSHAVHHVPSAGLSVGHPFAERVVRKAKRVAAPLVARFDVNAVLEYADAHEIEIFWVDRVLEHAFALYTQLRRRRPEALIVGDTEAVYSRFILRELPLIKNPLRKAWVTWKGRKKEAEERVLTATADAVTAVSMVDRAYFQSLTPHKARVRLFSNVVDLADFTEDRRGDIEARYPSVLLLGSFGHVNSPMDRAAQWVTEDIMPLVWQQVPDAHLYVVGRNADVTQGHRAVAHVTVIGKVPSMLPYIQNAVVALVPLRYESGTRFKIIEAGAASVPCVSTTLGAEGLDVTDGRDILIADTTEAFAAGIIRMIQQPDAAKKMGRALNALIVESYSIEAQTREGQAIIDFLRQGRD